MTACTFNEMCVKLMICASSSKTFFSIASSTHTIACDNIRATQTWSLHTGRLHKDPLSCVTLFWASQTQTINVCDVWKMSPQGSTFTASYTLSVCFGSTILQIHRCEFIWNRPLYIVSYSWRSVVISAGRCMIHTLVSSLWLRVSFRE